MDSGNSSSMQSSSGGGGDQEEYDSRADQSLSALFNNNATTGSSNIAGQTQLDSLMANYFNTGWSTDNTLSSTTTTNPTDGSRPQPQPMPSEPVFFTNTVQENLRVVSNTNTNTNTSSPIGSVPTDKKTGLATTRNPKKRSRVSRRAPTTVLTTDTSNFRAMVQEFTGNPSTPFTGLSSSPLSRSRFDLFGPSSSSSTSFSRPLKPFPHKLIPPSSTSHHYSTPPSTDYHQSLLRSMNMQNIANPFINNQSPNDVPLMDQSLSLRTSTGFGYVGANSEGLHNIIASSSSSMNQPTLNIIHGSNKNYEADNNLVRSIGGEEQPMVQRSDGYAPLVASGSENNITDVRNEGMVGLSWISSPD